MLLFVLLCSIGLLTASRLSIDEAKGVGNRWQPQPVTSEDASLNKYLPKKTADFMRIASIDCREATSTFTVLDAGEILAELEADVMVLISPKFDPKTWAEWTKQLSQSKYHARMISPLVDQTKVGFLVVSKFEILDIQRFSNFGTDSLFAADLALSVGKNQLRLLPININSQLDWKRLDDRACHLDNLKLPSIMLGSLSKAVKVNPSKDVFEQLKWPRSLKLGESHAILSNDLDPLGSFVYVTEKLKNFPLVVDISMKFSEIEAPKMSEAEDDSNSFSASDLIRLAIIWVPIVTLGTIGVCFLGILLNKRDKMNKACKVKGLPNETEMSSGWDTIDVNEERREESGRTRTATSQESGLSSRSSMIAPNVIRIQTPPGTPPESPPIRH